MSNYFSSLITRLGSEGLRLANYAGAADELTAESTITYITLYNPSWVSDNDESFEALSKLILFFKTQDDDELAQSSALPEAEQNSGANGALASLETREHLNIVGLIRGSCSLATEFGNSEGPITIQISGGAIVIEEVEPGYFLACCIALPQSTESRQQVLLQQLRALVRRTHGTFCVLNAPFERLISLYGREKFGLLVGTHWAQFIGNYNYAVKLPYGPRTLAWPTRMNYSGVFGLLPDSYRKSSVRIPDSLRSELMHILSAADHTPSGVFIANMSKAVPKKTGLMYLDLALAGESLDKESVLDVYKLLELLEFNGELNQRTLSSRAPLDNLFARIHERWVQEGQTVEEDESEDEQPANFTQAAALELLHPVKLTNTLVVLPLHSTVNGIMSLGQAFNEQMPQTPLWLRWRNHAEPVPEVPVEEEVVSGGFLTGPNDDDNSQFLVQIPTGKESREYSLVLYTQNEVLLGFLFDSSLEALSLMPFYTALKAAVCAPLLEVVNEAIQLSSGSYALSSSVGSLPGALGTAVNGKEQTDIDGDFFFVVYDTVERSFQTSLPYAPVADVQPDKHTELRRRVGNVMFHLHDQLADHFIVKSAGRMFQADSVVSEHLHKFSSNKTNDWLFYAIRYKQKVIIVIRNYNHRSKTPKTMPDEGYLHQLADSVYGYANLGFLDNLGEDVKVWLAGLGKEQESS